MAALLRVESVVAYAVEGGPYDGRNAWGWNLALAPPRGAEGVEPLVLASFPGAFDPEPLAVLGMGARRRDCQPAFTDRTVPYQPLFSEGPEALVPQPAGIRNAVPIVLVVSAAESLGYTLGDYEIGAPRGARVPLYLGDAATQGPVDANVVLWFHAGAGRVGAQLQVSIDGGEPMRVSSDGVLRARLASGPHRVAAFDGRLGAVHEVHVATGRCVERRVTLTVPGAADVRAAFER